MKTQPVRTPFDWDFWEVPERMLEAGYAVYLRSYMHHLSFVFYGL